MNPVKSLLELGGRSEPLRDRVRLLLLAGVNAMFCEPMALHGARAAGPEHTAADATAFDDVAGLSLSWPSSFHTASMPCRAALCLFILRDATSWCVSDDERYVIIVASLLTPLVPRAIRSSYAHPALPPSPCGHRCLIGYNP